LLALCQAQSAPRARTRAPPNAALLALLAQLALRPAGASLALRPALAQSARRARLSHALAGRRARDRPSVSNSQCGRC
jgi:hypothetical protein